MTDPELRSSAIAGRDTMAEQQPTADSPGKFSVIIRIQNSKSFAVPVSLDDSVHELKAKLSAWDSSLTPDGVRLIYNGQPMVDDMTLRQYNITPNSSLFCIRRLRGGGGYVDYASASSGLAPQALSVGLHKPLTDEASRSTEKSYRCVNLASPRPAKFCCCMVENLPKVMPEIIKDFSEFHTGYRAYLPGAGIFQCSITGLSFEVNSEVTITYRYDTWTEHLSKADQETWMPAGPLFHIEVQPRVVQTVYLPHFICLAVPLLSLAEGVNTSLCSIAHFESERMTLKKPTRLIAFSAVLENPSFSLLGVLWRKLRSNLNSLPMHSLVLIFQQLNAANTTLHLYLIPDDNSVKQAIEKQERNWNSKFIPKPPPLNPLFFGCVYQVISTKFVVIMPEAHLPFCYKSPKEQQLFVEIYIRNMAEEIGLFMTDTRNGAVVWRASLRSGDINLPASVSKTFSGTAFMKKYKTELCSRMSQLSTILLHLRDVNVINSEEEEEVQSQVTHQRRNQVLLELIEKKGLEAQEQLYCILQKKDPYLIADLEKSN
ncbi:caspase recruitment domain-containing protein 8-like isoform X1 [Falco rusticolus]|uniref:caspase recruitment domain-containing protein 8-like isoform X1 n=1 Tax=Falco cherrug TaxID=345164 RepID=UPI000FFC5412|nr:caspase recruitment domain-containing protein 8-like isoform X1 [Falco cherrug]XP_037231138.1 caspase recruitment domain-containing protein 8-like isoform X1 [Falco rusticolus]